MFALAHGRIVIRAAAPAMVGVRTATPAHVMVAPVEYFVSAFGGIILSARMRLGARALGGTPAFVAALVAPLAGAALFVVFSTAFMCALVGAPFLGHII